MYLCLPKNNDEVMRVKAASYIPLTKWLLLLVACMMGLPPLVANPPEPLFSPRKHEVRAVWLTTVKGLDWPKTRAVSAESRKRQQQELIDILDDLQAANINTVMLQTRVRGNLIYPSQYETWSEVFTGKAGEDPGYDPLAFAVEECHKRGMELHAWMVTFPLGSKEVQRDLQGKSVVKRQPRLVKRFRDNWYLNPGHPETKYYLASLVRELISRYDVDGVHFDYIRYPDRPRRFPDAADFKRYREPGEELADWRRRNITEIVRHLYHEVKRLKPWVKVSSAPLGKYRDTKRYPSRGWNAYHAVYQEAQVWMKEGVQDMIFPMLYYRGNDFYPFVLDWQEQSGGRVVVPGLGIYFLDPSEGTWTLADVEQQLNFIRWAGVSGEAHFRSQFLTDRRLGLYDRVKRDYYYTKALLPAMSWLDSIAPSIPSSGELVRSADGVTLQWAAGSDDTQGGVSYNIYASAVYPVDTDNPHHLLAARWRDTLYTHTLPLPSSAPLHYYAVTAMDRCGNESAPLQLGGGEAEVATPDAEAFNLLPVCDGVVELPHIPEAVQVILTDGCGRKVAQVPYHRRLKLTKLPAGFYRAVVVDNKGRTYVTNAFTNRKK